MAPADAEFQIAWLAALAEGQRFRGYVTWTARAQAWVRKELEGLILADIEQLMHDHVLAGGELDQVRERRQEYQDFEYHFDVRLMIGGRRVYIETVLLRTDPADPAVHIVSIHPA